MSIELKVMDPSVLTEPERTELDANIDALIAAHRDNRQEINRLVFESVAAMTAGEDYERQLANKKGLRRFLGAITGSNKKLQDKINSNRAAAQYASQQTLQRLAEQNLMSFDLITAVNNKLNASVTNIEGEINQIYSALLTFFKQNKSDMVKLESRVARLERNVNLLNWQNAIEYQMFDGVEYVELDDAAKIVCLVRDFYDITKGEWTTSDLLLLKTAMSTIDLPPRGEIDYYGFIKRVTYDGSLTNYLLSGRQLQKLPEPYLVPLLGMRKLELLDGEEGFIVDAIAETLAENHVSADRRYLQEELARKYLRQEAQVEVKTLVNRYDLIMEMLFNLQAADNGGLLEPDGEDEMPQIDEADKLEKDFQRAAEMFKNCELKEVHPLLVDLSEKGYARANALLYWLSLDGYNGYPSDEKKANEYAINGYYAGDTICAVQYAYNVATSLEEKNRLFDQYKSKLEELALSGDVFASYMMGIYYMNTTIEDIDYYKALEYFIVASSQNFYRAFYGIALRYYYGQGVEKDFTNAWLWVHKAMDFDEYSSAVTLAGDILYDQEEYDIALEFYLECIKRGGSPYNRVGYMYMTGQGMEIDCQCALEYFQKGVEREVSACYTNMGWIYEYGENFSHDLQKAIEYYRKSAELGDECGQYNLALCYLYGKGVPANREQAKYWLEKSAAQGWQSAIDMLQQNFG